MVRVVLRDFYMRACTYNTWTPCDFGRIRNCRHRFALNADVSVHARKTYDEDPGGLTRTPTSARFDYRSGPCRKTHQTTIRPNSSVFRQNRSRYPSQTRRLRSFRDRTATEPSADCRARLTSFRRHESISTFPAKTV